MDRSPSVAEIIAALGVSALARDFGYENVSTVSSWKLRGSIPPQHWKRIVEFAEARGVQGVTYERETAWGRPIVVHDYDLDRASQHRGGAGIFTPVLQRMKMLAKYDSVELDAAIINSLFAAYIESPFDSQLVGEALDDGEHLNAYQDERTKFHERSNDLVLGNARIPIMFPGEKINVVRSERPNGNFKAFESSFLRNSASAIGISTQQMTGDWSDVNYSSARGALLEAGKTLGRRRYDFAKGYCGPIRACWLEESVEVDDYPWPGDRRPDFPSFRGALSRARWLGPALGWLDPVAEVQAAVMRMEAGLSTLEDEAAQQGLEWEEVLEQRKFEIAKFEELGIALPQWGGAMTTSSIGRKPIEGQPGAKPEKAAAA